MKAAVFVEKGKPFEIRDYPLAEPAAGMASVTLEMSGICGTDVHIWDGAIAFGGPMIIGHEFLGRVQALGAGEPRDCFGEPLAAGDRVIVNVIEPCGTCRVCRAGGQASCLRLGESLVYLKSPEEAPHLHGGFAEATVVPIRYLHKMPAAIPANVAAAFLCAGPTVLCGLRYAGGVQPGEHVVVQGSGPVGLFAALYARHCRAASVTLIGSSSHPRRLELARRLGAGEVLDIRSTTLEQRQERIRSLTGGADLVIEGAGSPDAFAEGLGLLRNCGRYVLAGQYSDRGTAAIPPHVITFQALRIFGSAQFTAEDRRAYLDFLARAGTDWDAVGSVITDRYRVDQVNEAMAAVRAGRSIKAVLVPGR